MNSAQRRKKKEDFYRRGATAIKRYFACDLYGCPICGYGFDRTSLTNGELTLEHAPPASVGGKPIALTCRRCNTTSGHEIETNLSQRVLLDEFVETVRGDRRNDDGTRAFIQIEDERLATRVFQNQQGVRVLEVLAANNPKVIERVRERFENSEISELQITSRDSYDPRLAFVADLKAAFIVAFAALGYRYAFNRRLHCVRQQIYNPEEKLIDGWITQINSSHPSEYLLLSVEAIPALIVKLGKTFVILPWMSGPENIYKDLASRYPKGKKMPLTGRLIRWPTTLEMVLDLSDAPKQNRSFQE